MSEHLIGSGMRVTLNFALKLEDGAVVDSTFDKAPASLVIGDGNLPENFEAFLLGLSAGQHEVFTVTPEKAFGQHNPSNVQVLPRSQFAPDLTLEKGLILSFADKANGELPGVIADFDEQKVSVDFNHPLAGHTLNFEVQIIAVEPAEQNSTSEASVS
ncbi:FKBP-type peptidyl-prolyl cis-trans isomerase SlpA [Oceanospirillum multiglobuliferum]|uniref:Peptidyl-prolyl cis-trans isomerase n=1 Tax=Oceanospirillum multiglobuliferum TaxID=64969 RepID=A0A1T4LXI1_9GAMM|nr:peptidylprolyl isomerase [Oceanospirillum multiglobuliferum]OPX56320.1 peptidylprolyl isomerase [Oceanospirillum multiglobuliferum]SJZ59453.1 FKBP-type peptidyl-prolyl cis-trans isomerase SlpA [Oceanospirillum multiglobuliferum]